MKLLYSVTVVFCLAGFYQAFSSLDASWPFLVSALVTGLAANIAFFLNWKIARGILVVLGLVSLSLAAPLLAVGCIVGTAVGFLTCALRKLEKRQMLEREVAALYGHIDLRR